MREEANERAAGWAPTGAKILPPVAKDVTDFGVANTGTRRLVRIRDGHACYLGNGNIEKCIHLQASLEKDTEAECKSIDLFLREIQPASLVAQVERYPVAQPWVMVEIETGRAIKI